MAYVLPVLVGAGRGGQVTEEPPQRTRDMASGVLWERTGSCCRCGECCKSGDPFNGELGEAAVEGACPLFGWRDGLGHCTDRTNRYYVHGCASWPSVPKQIREYPGCSYVFARVEESDV